MRGMVLRKVGRPLEMCEMATPELGPKDVLIKVSACGVCRTDLHVFDGDLPDITTPRILGHEIVGTVIERGSKADRFALGALVGVPWLGGTCERCRYCKADQENLCDEPVFTGYTRDGGFATHAAADERFVISLDQGADPVTTAPLLCAGLIGWRSLLAAGDGRRMGIYGFGAAAHVLTPIMIWEGREVFAFTRPGDEESQAFARKLGVSWAGASDAPAPVELDAAIIFAPVGELVPMALRAVCKGGRVVCAGIHMSDIPSFPYRILWGERRIISVANLSRQDAHSFFDAARRASVKTHVVRYSLDRANEALSDLRHGRLQGAAVLVP